MSTVPIPVPPSGDNLSVFTEYGWHRFGLTLRVVITSALLMASVAMSLFAWLQPYDRWGTEEICNGIYATAMTLVCIGLIIGIVLLTRNRRLGSGLQHWVPTFWMLSTFVWLTTVVWTAITPHISTAATIADTLKVASISIIFVMAWRVAVRDVHLLTGLTLVGDER